MGTETDALESVPKKIEDGKKRKTEVPICRILAHVEKLRRVNTKVWAAVSGFSGFSGVP